MSDIKKQEHIDDLRKRLYDREAFTGGIDRHTLAAPVDVTRNWQPVAPPVTPVTPAPPAEPVVVAAYVPPPVATQKPRRRYRLVVVLVTLLIMIGGVGFSAFYVLTGSNQISSGNIGIVVSGPPALGGGEMLSLQVGVTNQNNVPIEAATLILKYPDGVRSLTENARELFEERIAINTLAAGEVRNVPIQVALFGEEGAEKKINATLEYRIAGSNGTFYKDAEPITIQITSTPLVLRVTSVEKVASGQLVDVKVVAQSNASTPLNNIIVQAEYPNGFDFERATPAPSYGEGVWVIREVKPEETFEITIRGIVTGLTAETFRINFSAGPAAPDNQYVMSSRLTQGWVDLTIERPFINVAVTVDGKQSQLVTIPSGQTTNVSIDVQNTLDETVYDMVVEVVPGGNALNDRSIISDTGFYDSNTGTVRWEVSNNNSFREVIPGDKRSLTFRVVPVPGRSTATFDLVVNVYARRIAETRAQEQLIGTAQVQARYSSLVTLGSQVSFGGGVFTNSGPVPPRVGQSTTYTVTLVAEAGVNDIVNTLVSTRLPLYVSWQNEYQGDGEIVYNSVSKELEWRPGDIAMGARKELSFTLGFLPSASQIDTTPVLVNTQQMRANDRFTGDLLQANAPALTTQISAELGYGIGSGRVQGN